MRLAHALLLIAFSSLGSGCALVEDGARNFCYSISSVCENHREKERNRRWAESAWSETCGTNGPTQRTEDYAEGFKDGYEEYLFRGGDGEPPPVAPQRYRHFRYQNPQGYHAIEDWFSGYRHGASVARDSGARRWIVGPSTLHSDHPEVLLNFKAPTPVPTEKVVTKPMEKSEPRPMLVQHSTPPVGVTAKMPSGPSEPPIRQVEIVVEHPVEQPVRAKITDVRKVAPPAEPLPRAETTTAKPVEIKSVTPVVYEPSAQMPTELQWVTPVVADEPKEKPARLKITEVREALPPTVRVEINNVNQAPLERARITNINNAPTPARATIKTVTTPKSGESR